MQRLSVSWEGDLTVPSAQFLGNPGDACVDTAERLSKHPQPGFQQGGFGFQQGTGGGIGTLVGVEEHAALPWGRSGRRLGAGPPT